jgi:formyl-CoA transferase
MYESVFALLESAVSEYGAGGVIRQPAGSAMPNLAPSNTYRCADGTWACLTSTSDRLFTRLCEAMERPELTADPRFRSNSDRTRNRDALDGIIADWVKTRAYAQVEKRLLAVAVPVSRIFSIRDCVEDPHYRHRKTIIEVPEDDGRITLQPNIFPSFSGADAPVLRWPGPSLGEHNAEVLTGLLGLSQQALTALAQEGVI